MDTLERRRGKERIRKLKAKLQGTTTAVPQSSWWSEGNGVQSINGTKAAAEAKQSLLACRERSRGLSEQQKIHRERSHGTAGTKDPTHRQRRRYYSTTHTNATSRFLFAHYVLNNAGPFVFSSDIVFRSSVQSQLAASFVVLSSRAFNRRTTTWSTSRAVLNRTVCSSGSTSK